MEVIRPPWWINPIALLGVFILPVFLISTIYGADSLAINRIYSNYMDWESVPAGICALFALCVGSGLAIWLAPASNNPLHLPEARTNTALIVLASLAIASQVFVIFDLVISYPGLVMQAINGEQGAIYELHDTAVRIPGLTSLMNVRGVFFALVSACLLDRDFRLARWIWPLYAALVVTTLMYSFIVSERVVIIEMGVAALLAPLTFKLRPSFFRATSPFVGMIGIFGLFAVGEYFRSWPFYQGTGIQFSDFAFDRFVGYFASSINNGAGYYLKTDPTLMPYWTAGWLHRFPLWDFLGISMDASSGVQFQSFLNRFANPEFNNYSGVYAALIDFGLPLGCLYLTIWGFLGGLVYRSFVARGLLGLILYPVWIYGYFDIIRVFYWGEPRFVPLAGAAIAVYFYIRG
ncbi:hypothetical protein, partial [Methylobacterium soli]